MVAELTRGADGAGVFCIQAGPPEPDALGVDGLLGALLNEEEIDGVLRGRSECPEIFAEAARFVIARALRGGKFDDGTAARLRAVFQDHRARKSEHVTALAPRHAVSICLADEDGVVQGAVESYFAKARIPDAVLEEITDHEVAGWDSDRLYVWLRLLAGRASDLVRYPRGARAGERACAVSLVERVLLGGRAEEELAGAERDGAGVPTGCVFAYIADILDALYPAVSLPLLERLLRFCEEFPARAEGLYHAPERWSGRAAAYAALPEVFSEERAARFLNLRCARLDACLAQNPALDDATLWRLYARYSAGGARAAGAALCYQDSLVRHFAGGGHAEALRGAYEQRFRDNRADDLPDEAVRVLYDSVLAGEAPADWINRAVARESYRRFGAGPAAALVGLGDDAIAKGLAELWAGEPKDDELFRALLAYPKSAVRATLVPKNFYGMKPEHVSFYRDVGLPLLAADRSRLLREKASGALVSLCRDVKEPEDNSPALVALRAGTIEDLGRYAEGARVISPEEFEILFGRATDPNNSSQKYRWQCMVLKPLARRADLSLVQYRRLVALGEDEITALAVRALPDEFEGDADYLRALVGAGPETLESLAGRRRGWGEADRRFFLTHRDTRVRAALAHHNEELGPGDVTTLLADDEASVRTALVSGKAWKRYFGRISEKLHDAT